MKEQFVPYEIALALKEIDFNEKCFANYRPISSVDTEIILEYSTKVQMDCGAPPLNEYNTHKMWCAAPLWQQVIDWLNVEYGSEFGINLTLPFYQPNDRVYYNYVKTTIDWDVQFPTYQKACEQTILKAIELIKNQNGTN